MESNGKKGKVLKPRQQLAINHLSNGKNLSETARLVGVSRQTVGTWMRSAAFQQAVNAALDKKRAELQARYQAAEPGIFDFWNKVMNDESAKLSDRLLASRLIVNQSHLFPERRDNERLEKLEEWANQEREQNGRR